MDKKDSHCQLRVIKNGRSGDARRAAAMRHRRIATGRLHQSRRPKQPLDE
ncbi:hypothetical protein D779_1860 [Imhoffiella purpurea]|uniref:Uncharacterized protein n=1 Tax=Imhoffiella purpurea TaxID=1249627 RepID=W9VLQ6_9GAMM|nr:hypothetical protein D779_1860 [Imhoffiella purpurea]